MNTARNQSSKSTRKNLLSALRRDKRGGAALLIGFSLPVIIGALGIGLDTGMWYLEKRKLQQMADTAGLGAVRALHDGASVDTAKTVAVNDAKRNGYTAGGTTNITVNSPPASGAYAGQSNAVEVVISKKLPLFFSAYFLSEQKTVSVRSVAYQASVLGKNLEVSMMLDVSTSMGGNSEVAGVTKLKGMQDASKELIDIVVQASQTPYKSRVAIVPYSSAVNVGSTYYTTVTNKTLSGSWSSVVERSGTNKFTDEAPSATAGWLGSFKDKRSGAMGDYASYVQNLNSNVPSTSLMSPLSTSKTDLKATIDGFSANGTTAGHIGVAWSWYTLSPKWASIFTGDKAPAAVNASATQKVAVLLSDFEMNSYYVSGNGNSSTQTASLCTAMKAAGITVYTVGYGLDTSNTTAKNLWQNCATSADHRFTATTVAQLKDAFKTIAAGAVSGASSLVPRIVE
jgi:Flp pilus assembly protein TadG